MQQSACLFFLLKETKAAPEKQDRNDLPGKDEHHDYYFKETGRRSKDQRIKERDGRAGGEHQQADEESSEERQDHWD